MKGDFSAIRFDASKQFSRVLQQQGRVTLDADTNERAEILLHALRTLARDLIGPCGGPADALGFRPRLLKAPNGALTLRLGAGRYYVDGILVENPADCDYARQAQLSLPADDPLLRRLAGEAGNGEDFWLYLDVWERHVSAVEDDSIREVALNGPDTCTRTQVVWQVRAVARSALLANLNAQLAVVAQRLADPAIDAAEKQALTERMGELKGASSRLQVAEDQDGRDCTAPLYTLTGLSNALMTARVDPGQQVPDACTVPPDALYRGVENQLYRVEVHRGSAPGVRPSFKWSRDNGSVATRVLPADGSPGEGLLVAHSRGFSEGCWVEFLHDALELAGLPGVMGRLVKVDGTRLTVDPASIPAGQTMALTPELRNPRLRRWDQVERGDVQLDQGAIAITESGAADPAWIDLEDGVQVQFGPGGSYRTGDHWLVPARVATGSIDWPRSAVGGSVDWLPQSPAGIEHHFAPLGYVGVNAAGVLEVVTDCGCVIEPVGDCGGAVRRAGVGEIKPRRPRGSR